MLTRVERAWGHYTELMRCRFLCIKVLTFSPQSRLSMQRHFHRSEIWLGKMGCFWFRCKQWHQFRNDLDEVLRFIEIQYGWDVRESDIERL